MLLDTRTEPLCREEVHDVDLFGATNPNARLALLAARALWASSGGDIAPGPRTGTG
jgi:hypothetical protein